MRRAITPGNHILVNFLLKGGFPADSLIGGLSCLVLSLILPNGKISLKLLQNGADPCSPCPDIPKSPMISLALRPNGSYTRDIVKEMITRGATQKEYKIAYKLVYARAIQENWQEVLDILESRGFRATATVNNILPGLLSQNSSASLASLRGFLCHAAAASRSPDPFLGSTDHGTVFHVLISVKEEIRDDRLNFRALELLLKFRTYRSPNVIQALNEQYRTALSIAVSQGNVLGVGALLKHGASPDVDYPTPVLQALERLLYPPIRAATFLELSNLRQSERRRWKNSVQMINTFASFPETWSLSLRQRASVAINTFAPTWQSREFLERSMTKALAATRSPRYRVVFPQLPICSLQRPLLEDMETKVRTTLRREQVVRGIIILLPLWW